MSLAPGTRVGPYEMLSLLGMGGMGEVYRARDQKLQRDVALKILPEAFASDPERLARFEREARTLAALNHPHIAQIYGFEQGNGVSALVIELVEGEDLAQRLARGALPLDEAVPIARQIADALEAAHEQGIIHRDLKPANVKVRDDGTVKVLDFGLAKALERGQGSGIRDQGSVSAADFSAASPTVTTPAMITMAGLILGTAAYMSPEQAKGKPADKRSDIWAFGCVLYEMLTGTRPFGTSILPSEPSSNDANDVAETLAAVLRAEPDWSALPTEAAAPIRTLLQQCLVKDRRARVGDIAVAKFVLADPARLSASRPVQAVGLPMAARARWRTAAIVVASALVTAVLVATVMRVSRPVSRSTAVMRFPIPLADNHLFVSSGLPLIAISDDGQRVAYAAGITEGGVTLPVPKSQRIYLRSMPDDVARPIPGTEGESFVGGPVFAPDGESLVYFDGDVSRGGNGAGLLARATGALKRIPVGGGTAVTVCQAELPLGMSWTADTLLFAQRGKGIFRVPASGGTPEQIVSLKQGEIVQGPQLLREANAVLFARGIAGSDAPGPSDDVWDRAEIVVQSLASGEQKVLLHGGSDARYLRTGHIVYATSGILRAVPFDVTHLQVTGDPVALVEGVRRSRFGPTIRTGSAHYGVAHNGTLIYLSGPVSPGTIMQDVGFLERNAIERVTPLKLPPATYAGGPTISPDGARLALCIQEGNETNVWIHDLSGASALRQLTFGGTNRSPIWSPDGRALAFYSDREGQAGIYTQHADGGGPAVRLTSAPKGISQIPSSWAPDGNQILFDEQSPGEFALRVLSLRDKESAPVGDIRSPTTPSAAKFSPDGRWIAYQSGDVARPQIFVQPFPGMDAKYKIADGRQPRWSRDGKQLLYVVTNRFFTTDVDATAGFNVSNPVLFAQGLFPAGPFTAYDITPDGQRIVGVTEAPGQIELATGAARNIAVVINWFEELRQRVPVK